VARDERAAPGATDGDLVADLERELAAEHPDDLVAVAMEMEQALGSDGHGLLEQHDAPVGLVTQQLQRRVTARGGHVEMLSTAGGDDEAPGCVPSRVHGDSLPWGLPGLRPLRESRLKPDFAAGHERPQVAIPRETPYFHLAVESCARPLGDALRAGVLGKN